jgi:hypothetical protein
MNFDFNGIWYDIWHDKKGKIVIWQTPNILLIAWVVITIISLFLSGNASNAVSVIGDIALLAWAALELAKGVNYFRKALGLLVLVLATLSLIHIV